MQLGEASYEEVNDTTKAQAVLVYHVFLNPMQDKEFKFIILDEAHHLRNSSSCYHAMIGMMSKQHIVIVLVLFDSHDIPILGNTAMLGAIASDKRGNTLTDRKKALVSEITFTRLRDGRIEGEPTVGIAYIKDLAKKDLLGAL